MFENVDGQRTDGLRSHFGSGELKIFDRQQTPPLAICKLLISSATTVMICRALEGQANLTQLEVGLKRKHNVKEKVIYLYLVVSFFKLT